MFVELTQETITLLTYSSVAVAVLGCLVAAYTDFRWGIVPDNLNYALIAIGIVSVFLRFELWDAALVYGLALLVFLIGLAAYTFGQLGGGDVKFFAALALLIPFYPMEIADISPFFPFSVVPYPFIVSVFFLAAVLAVFFVSLHYLYLIWKDRNAIADLKHMALRGAINSMFVIVPLSILWAMMNPMMILVIIPISLGAFLLPFKVELLKRYMMMEKKVKDLNDDDVLALELISEDVKKKLGLSTRKTFFNVELEKIKENAKKNGIKKVPVTEYLPRFVPYILISLVLNLLLGDAFLWMLSMG